MDIGVGDGATSAPFIEAGCKKIVGIDLNIEMLKTAREKLGDSLELIKMNAIKMNFVTGQFSIVIAGAAIHNISKEDRKSFWKELLRLSPNLFIMAEKIADSDVVKHKKLYDREIKAIKKVYGEKYNLRDVEKEWLEHYKHDEREQLNINEIIDNLGGKYDIEIVEEIGIYKTVVLKKKIK